MKQFWKIPTKYLKALRSSVFVGFDVLLFVCCICVAHGSPKQCHVSTFYFFSSLCSLPFSKHPTKHPIQNSKQEQSLQPLARMCRICSFLSLNEAVAFTSDGPPKSSCAPRGHWRKQTWNVCGFAIAFKTPNRDEVNHFSGGGFFEIFSQTSTWICYFAQLNGFEK